MPLMLETVVSKDWAKLFAVNNNSKMDSRYFINKTAKVFLANSLTGYLRLLISYIIFWDETAKIQIARQFNEALRRCALIL